MIQRLLDGKKISVLRIMVADLPTPPTTIRPSWLLILRRYHTWYLSFFLHEQNFWRIKFTPKKRVNYDKIQRKLPIFLRYYGKIHSKLPIFRVKSVKIYTGQKKFTRASLVGSWQIWGMILMIAWELVRDHSKKCNIMIKSILIFCLARWSSQSLKRVRMKNCSSMALQDNGVISKSKFIFNSLRTLCLTFRITRLHKSRPVQIKEEEEKKVWKWTEISAE